MPLDLAELFADADEPANLAPGHIPAPGSFQPFDEFLIALIEIEPVKPAFLDQDRDAQPRCAGGSDVRRIIIRVKLLFCP